MSKLKLILFAILICTCTSCYEHKYQEGTIEYEIENEIVKNNSNVKTVSVVLVDSFDTRDIERAILSYKHIIDSCYEAIGDASIIDVLLPNANSINNILSLNRNSKDYAYRKYDVVANIKYQNERFIAYYHTYPEKKIEIVGEYSPKDESSNEKMKILNDLKEMNMYGLTIDSLKKLANTEHSILLKLKETELKKREQERLAAEREAEKAEKQRLRDALEEVRLLYQELLIYKKSPAFYKYGFTKEPYITWKNKISSLDSRMSREIASEYGFTVSELTSIALEYMSHYGEDSEYTRFVRNNVEKALRTLH